MQPAQRYLVFAIMDVLLAAFVFYRSLWPVIQGEVAFRGGTWFSIVICLLLLGMSVRFAWAAKKHWE